MDDFGLLVGRHFTSLPTLSDEQPHELLLDDKGRLVIAGRFLAGTDSHADGDPVVVAGVVRKDSEGALTGAADGEYTQLQVDSSGRLKVATLVSVEPSDAEYAEDSAHTSGHTGIFGLSIRIDDISADNSALTAGTDGDYQGMFTNIKGETYTHDTDVLDKLTDIEVTIDNGIDVTLAPEGAETYTVTDDLAVAGDGLETITAAATPWVTVASVAVGAGQTAHIYGWQFACDKNCEARIMTDDTTDEITYKTSVNSSAMPSVSEHFASEGRIEIAGAASLELRIEMKKRNGAGGNGQGTGSLHVRIV